jgi:prepilin signal peptidase PulO-like enzyme (type II secretory pathway)
MTAVLLLAAAGLLSGLFLPELSEAICRLKYRRKGKELTPDRRFRSWPLRLFTALLNAAGWGFLAWMAKPTAHIALSCVIWYASILIGLTDARVRLVPNELLLLCAAAGIAQRIVLAGVAGLISSAIFMVVLMVFFVSAAKLVGGLWCVGAGDVKLAGVMGLVMGYPTILTGVLAMAVSMFLFCGIGLLTKKLSKTSMIPLAPFLSLGMLAGLAVICLP